MLKGAALLAAVLLLFSAVQPGPAAAEGGAGARADLGRYHTYDDMVSELLNLTRDFPNITELIPLRQTYEGRTLWAVKVSDNVTRDEAEPNFTILGGIHAAEWPGVEVALYVLESIVTGYSSNSSLRSLVDRSQLWVVPMLNPDGHAFVEQGNNWRKNRNPFGGGTGVDLNRNFGHLWGLEAGHSPSNDDYCGPSPFSENETLAVRDLVTVHHPTSTISYHTFGGNILYPWGSTLDPSPVDPRLRPLAQNMSLAMPAARRYTTVQASAYYSATGDTDDFFLANLSILPFTIELGSTGTKPQYSEVAALCEENLPVALYLINYTVGPEPPRPVNHSLGLSWYGQPSALPGSIITLPGLLRNRGDAAENVTLNISTNNTWPAWMSFNGTGNVTVYESALPLNGTIDIRIHVLVPPGARAGESTRVQVAVTSTAGASDSMSMVCTAEKSHNISVSLTGPSQVRANNTVIAWAQVRNGGNGLESLLLSASTVPKCNYNMSLESQLALRNPLNLTAGETENLTITMQLPRNLTADTIVNLTFKVGTDYDLASPITRNLLMSVLPSQNLSVAAGLHNLGFPAGQNRTVDILLRNDGNGWENGTLRLSGDTIYASLDNRSLQLPPFSNQTVHLDLTGKKKGNWTVRLQFLTADNELRGEDNVTFTVVANKTAERPVPPDPIPVVVVLVLITVISLALLYWEFQRVGRRAQEEAHEREMRRRELKRRSRSGSRRLSGDERTRLVRK